MNNEKCPYCDSNDVVVLYEAEHPEDLDTLHCNSCGRSYED